MVTRYYFSLWYLGGKTREYQQQGRGIMRCECFRENQRVAVIQWALKIGVFCLLLSMEEPILLYVHLLDLSLQCLGDIVLLSKSQATYSFRHTLRTSERVVSCIRQSGQRHHYARACSRRTRGWDCIGRSEGWRWPRLRLHTRERDDAGSGDRRRRSEREKMVLDHPISATWMRIWRSLLNYGP